MRTDVQILHQAVNSSAPEQTVKVAILEVLLDIRSLLNNNSIK